jgi:O-antigen/teichoic acid export membrane protein
MPSKDTVSASGLEDGASERRIVRGSSIGLIGGGYQYVGIVVFTVIAARSLGVVRLGVWAVALVLVTALAEVADLGLDLAVLRISPPLIAEGRNADVRRMTTTAVGLALTGAVLYAVLGATAGPGVMRALHVPSGAQCIGILAISIPFSAVTDVLAATLAARRTVAASTALTSGVAPTLRVAGAAAAAAGGLGLRGFAVGYTAAEVGTCMVGAALVIHRFAGVAAGERPSLRRLLGFGLPASASKLLLYSNEQVPLLLLAALGPAAAVGQFQVCQRLGVAAPAVLAATGAIFMPVIADQLSRGTRSGVTHVFGFSTWWALVIGLPVALFIVANAGPLLSLFGHGFQSATGALAVLSVGWVFDLSTGCVGALLLMGGWARMSLANAALYLAVTAAAGVLLIPPHGLVGAAIATTLGMCAVNAIRVVEVRRLLSVQPFRRRHLLVAGIALVALAPTFVIPDWGDATLVLAARLTVFVAVYIPLAYRFAAAPGDRIAIAQIRRRRSDIA